jgi:hypothetical protein
MLWVAGLAWGPRDLVPANAEKAVLRTIAAHSTIFVLISIFQHLFELFVGSIAPRPAIGGGISS